MKLSTTCLSLSFVLFLFSSCYKEPIDTSPFYAEVNVVHLNSELNAIDVTVADERPFVHGLGQYQQSGYAKLDANPTSELLLLSSSQPSVLMRKTYELVDQKRYSWIIFERAGATRSIWLEDLKKEEATNAYVRLINLVEDQGPIQHNFDLKNAQNEFLQTDAPNMEVGGFLNVPTEPTIFTIHQSDNPDKAIQTDAINLSAGHQYTIVVEGTSDNLSTFVWEH